MSFRHETSDWGLDFRFRESSINRGNKPQGQHLHPDFKRTAVKRTKNSPSEKFPMIFPVQKQSNPDISNNRHHDAGFKDGTTVFENTGIHMISCQINGILPGFCSIGAESISVRANRVKWRPTLLMGAHSVTTFCFRTLKRTFSSAGTLPK